MSTHLPKSYSKNSRTARELAKEMDKVSQKSQPQISSVEKEQKCEQAMINPLNIFAKNVQSITEKNRIVGMLKPPVGIELINNNNNKNMKNNTQNVNQMIQQAVIGSHTSLALYKYKNFRRMYGEEKYILDTHTYTSVQNYIDSLKLNEAEAAEKPLDLFTFNDREFDSIQKPQKLIHRDEDKPMSRELADLIDCIQFIRAVYICEEPYKHFFYPTREEEIQHENNQPIRPPHFTQNIIQGQLQSVHFLNALILVCSNRDLFDRLCFLEPEQGLQENYKNGIYAFRFYKNKTQKYTVIIDDKIPCVSLSNEKPVPCFSRSQDSNSLWISLIEKAYAKLNGGYSPLENISLREAINDLTGLEPEIIPFVDKEYLNTTNIFPTLHLLTTNRSVVGVLRIGTLNGQGSCWNKSQEGRMYIVKGVNLGNKKIIIQNGWFNTGLLNGKKFLASESEIDEEREYEITTEEFYQLFNTFVILKDFSDEFRGVRFDVNLSPSYGLPNANNVSWINNSQFIFEYTDKVDTNFIIRISETKGIQQPTSFINVGFALFSLSEKVNQ